MYTWEQHKYKDYLKHHHTVATHTKLLSSYKFNKAEKWKDKKNTERENRIHTSVWVRTVAIAIDKTIKKSNIST